VAPEYHQLIDLIFLRGGRQAAEQEGLGTLASFYLLIHTRGNAHIHALNLSHMQR
jgi:hypothetical protein